ncbi:M56 family metallopeptidase [Nakamurella lactea]|uniref:M56 family metallopeptidase n=1 Tax=Nakamurella lactea TaxID=459515 RepID=UPI00041BB4C5|nr:M56 family metallopeptidase [Nakamurella lactea]
MSFPLIALLLALLACFVVGRSANPLMRKVPPAQAVPLVTVAALAVSLAAGVALTAIAIAVIAGLSSVAADGRWSAAELRTEVPIPWWLGALAAAVVLALLARAAVRTARIVVALVRADRLCRIMRAGGGPIVMVDDDSADAFTVAGLRGCVVISRRLFAGLRADERRVLTAHELSHLTRRHHLFVHLADIASAANPLLTTVSGAVRFGVERWADEDAAVGIGDRRRTGRALARVALLRSSLAAARPTLPSSSMPNGSSRSAGIPALGVATQQVMPRVQALLNPAPRRRTVRLLAAGAVAFGVLIVGMASLDHIHEAIETATPYVHHVIHR